VVGKVDDALRALRAFLPRVLAWPREAASHDYGNRPPSGAGQDEAQALPFAHQ
jgi:hypothetical protein